MEMPFSAGHSNPMPASLWAATTAATIHCAALRGAHKADVTVIGAGIMGLSVALELSRRNLNVIVVDAAAIGWGASGRNNGLLAPGLKRDPFEVRKILGTEAADRLLRIAGAAPDVVANLVEQHDIKCDLRRNGWIQAAHATRAMPILERRVREWQELGADTQLLAASDVSTSLGTEFYVGAAVDRRGGSLNPLAYVRGLAAAAQRAGVPIFENTPVTQLARKQKSWEATVPGGVIQCETIVCCTNAYNHSINRLRGCVIPLRTAQVASRPLPANLARQILPGGESASDTQRLLTSFRLTADNRLISGGASATAGDKHAGLLRHLHRGARMRFPQLGEIEWEFGWSGYLALSANHLPKIFRMDDNCWGATACNGRGIGMATVTGQHVAHLVCGEAAQDCAIPIESPQRITGFALRGPGVAVGVLINRFMDVAERRLSSG